MTHGGAHVPHREARMAVSPLGNAWVGGLAARLSRAIAAMSAAPWHHDHHQHHDDDHGAVSRLRRDDDHDEYPAKRLPLRLRCHAGVTRVLHDWGQVHLVGWRAVLQCARLARSLLAAVSGSNDDHHAAHRLRFAQLPDNLLDDQRRIVGEVQRGCRWHLSRQRQFWLLRGLSWQSVYAVLLVSTVGCWRAPTQDVGNPADLGIVAGAGEFATFSNFWFPGPEWGTIHWWRLGGSAWESRAEVELHRNLPNRFCWGDTFAVYDPSNRLYYTSTAAWASGPPPGPALDAHCL